MIYPKKTIANAEGYEPQIYIENFRMKLDLNENVIGPSPKVLEAIRNITPDDLKFYPAYGELIDKIAEINNVDKSMILPTNGADEAINYIFDTFITQDDTVLTVTPTFSMPKIYARAIGCNYKEVKYSKRWVFPVDELIKNIDKTTRLIIITTPNSPTGESISEESLLKILNNASNSVVLLDETYSSFAPKQYTNLVEKFKNLIITRSLSKDYALAGLRLGYILTDNQNIKYIMRIISPFSVNALAAKAAIVALNDTEYFESVKSQINLSKTILTQGLNGIAKEVYPSDANFILADFGQKADFYYKRLLSQGIKVKYFSKNPEINTCFRITLPSPDDAKNIIECLKPREMLIFDMDGVLVDTSNSYRKTIKQTYEHFSGKNISFEQIQDAKNLGGLNNDWDLTEYLLLQQGINIEKKDIILKFQEFYWGDNGNGNILNENLLISRDILKKLSQEYDLAIFTGRPKLEADFVLNRWNIKDCFSPVITMEDVPEGMHKPDPYGIKLILDLIKPTKACYFGDTPDDMISAKKANITSIGVLPPHDKSDKLRSLMFEAGASAIIEDVSSIICYLGANNYAKK